MTNYCGPISHRISCYCTPSHRPGSASCYESWNSGLWRCTVSGRRRGAPPRPTASPSFGVWQCSDNLAGDHSEANGYPILGEFIDHKTSMITGEDPCRGRSTRISVSLTHHTFLKKGEGSASHLISLEAGRCERCALFFLSSLLLSRLELSDAHVYGP